MRKDGLATIVTYSTFTCFQEILTEVEENGDNIEEVIELLAPPLGKQTGLSSFT